MSKARMVYTMAAATAATVSAAYAYSQHKQHSSSVIVSSIKQSERPAATTLASKNKTERTLNVVPHSSPLVKAECEIKDLMKHQMLSPTLLAEIKKNEARTKEKKPGFFPTDPVKSHYDAGDALLKQGNIALAKIAFEKMLFAKPKKNEHAAIYEIAGGFFQHTLNFTQEASWFLTIATLLKSNLIAEVDQFVKTINLSDNVVSHPASLLSMRIS